VAAAAKALEVEALYHAFILRPVPLRAASLHHNECGMLCRRMFPATTPAPYQRMILAL